MILETPGIASSRPPRLPRVGRPLTSQELSLKGLIERVPSRVMVSGLGFF